MGTAILVGAVLFGGCSSDGGDDSSTTTAAPSGSDGSAGEALTQADAEAFLAAAIAGNGDEAFSECLGGEVYAEVQEGGLTAEEVRAWTNGDAPVGPVQDFISTMEIITECSGGGGDGEE